MREVYEETGLEAEVVRLIGIYTSPHQIVAYSDGQNFQYVSMSFEAKAVGGTLSLSEETIAFGYFSRPEIAQLDLIADQVVRVADAFADQETTFIR